MSRHEYKTSRVVGIGGGHGGQVEWWGSKWLESGGGVI